MFQITKVGLGSNIGSHNEHVSNFSKFPVLKKIGFHSIQWLSIENWNYQQQTAISWWFFPFSSRNLLSNFSNNLIRDQLSVLHIPNNRYAWFSSWSFLKISYFSSFLFSNCEYLCFFCKRRSHQKTDKLFNSLIYRRTFDILLTFFFAVFTYKCLVSTLAGQKKKFTLFIIMTDIFLVFAFLHGMKFKWLMFPRNYGLLFFHFSLLITK